MEVLRVTGGRPLRGEVTLTGAKNSVLKLMAAALLAPGTTTITNVPDILDVEIMAELLRRLGCDVTHDIEGAALAISVPAEPDHRADYDLVRRMRASICVLGPLLTQWVLRTLPFRVATTSVHVASTCTLTACGAWVRT